MSKLYFFHPKTREFIHARDAQVIPGLCVEKAADFPNCSDKQVPGEIPEGFAAVLGEGDDGDWTLVEDHRGDAYRKVDGRKVQIEELGPVPAELTLQAPLKDGRWNEEASRWELDPDQVRAVKMRAVDSLYAGRLAQGFAFQGKQLQADDISQARINGAVTLALVTGDAYSVTWTCADNSTLTLDHPGTLAMGAACGEFVQQTFYRRRALKDALLDAASVEEIEAVDIDSNWP